MKNYFYLPFLLCFIFSSTYSQIIQTGAFHGPFGIDADTRSGYAKNCAAPPSPNTIDDWFSLTGDRVEVLTMLMAVLPLITIT
jgi:hypothetical protein